MSARMFGALTAVLALATAAPAAEPELHVVATHVGHGAPRDHSKPGTAAVTVDRPGKDVVLVVHAYNPTDWEVRATAKTNLKRVFAVGYHRQTALAPKGVVVEELTADGREAGVSTSFVIGTHEIERPRFRPMVRALADLTDQKEIASFQGTYQFDPKKPFVVDAVQKDERLNADFPKLPPAAQIPKLKFEATRPVLRDRGDVRTGFGEFTQAGPTADRFVALPKGVRQLAYDPNGKQHYGIDNHELYAIDMKTGAATKLDRPQGFSWPRALTHDAKRDRLVIVSRGGLFEYDTKGGKWAQLTNEPFGSHAALAWQVKTDTLWAFAVERDRKDSERLVPTLFELNANGVIVKRTPLGAPLFPGILGEYGRDGYAELIDLGAELALLVHTENRDSGTGERGKPEAFLYVIDPKTGRVTLAWKE